MRGWRSGVAWAACRLWRGRHRVLPARPGSRVLMYHAIGSDVPGDRLGLYRLEPASFQAQMALLLESPHTVRSLPEAVLAADGLAITFDDGFRDCLRTAAPVLVGFGLPFTVFIAAGFIRSGDSLYLSVGELRELASLPGAAVGAHGDTHVRLTACDDRMLRTELTDSRRYLEDLLQQPVTMMSYPHGAVDARVRAAAAEAGYTLAAGSRFGVNTSAQDPLELRRTDIWGGDTPGRFGEKLRGDWDWLG